MTLAALMLHKSSHTVPHVPSWKTSTLPSDGIRPPIKRISVEGTGSNDKNDTR